jgi:hypothetical protein
MIAQTFSSWRILWLKEWLIPKAGTAFTVVTLSAIFFSLDSGEWLTGQTANPFDSIFASTSRHWFLAFLIIMEVLLLFATSVAMSKDGKVQRDMLPLVRLAPKLAFGVNFVLGMLLVPLVVALTYATMHRSSATILLLAILSIYGAFYVGLSALIHWLMYAVGTPPQHIVYTLTPLKTKAIDEAVQETSGRLGKVLSQVPLVDAPVIVGHTKDGQITLIVTLKLDWNHWNDDPQRALLQRCLDGMELEWRDNSWAFSRVPYPDLSFTPRKST